MPECINGPTRDKRALDDEGAGAGLLSLAARTPSPVRLRRDVCASLAGFYAPPGEAASSARLWIRTRRTLRASASSTVITRSFVST